METESTCNINLDSEPKRESETERDRNHVLLRQPCATESEEVKFPFNGGTDSFRLLSVYRYAERIKHFLGWREDFDARENFSLDNLSVNGKQCSNDSLKKELDLSEQEKKNSCKEGKGNRAFESLSDVGNIFSNDNQDIGLSLLFSSDIDNFQEKYEENICISSSQHRQRNSYYLEIKNSSDYPFENKIKLSTDSYYADESDNSASTLEKDFEKDNSPKEILRSSFHLEVVDSKTEKGELISNSDFGDFILNNNKKPKMDKHFLKDNEIVDAGLMLNDEHSIIQDENETISLNNNEKNNGNIKSQLEDFIPEDKFKTDSNTSEEKIKCETNSETTHLSEEIANCFSSVEKNITETENEDLNQDENETISLNNNETNNGNIKNQLQDFIPDDNVETDSNIPDKKTKCDTYSETNCVSEEIANCISSVEKNITDTDNDDFNQNKSSFQIHEGSVKTDDCKNIVGNKINENYKNNVINSKLDKPLKAYVQNINDTNKANLSKEIKNNEKQILEEYDEDTVCGLGFFKPRWLQPYATAKTYVILYSLLGVFHGSYYAYLISTMSTLEKRFAFKSKISGTIMIVDELTPLFIGIVVSYYAAKAHRPRIVALGMLLSAGCCFVTTLPYFIYGPMQNTLFNDVKSNIGPEYCDSSTERCDADKPQNLLAVLLLIAGSFLKGFGNLAYYAIGLVYLDNNSDKQSTPLYLGKLEYYLNTIIHLKMLIYSYLYN